MNETERLSGLTLTELLDEVVTEALEVGSDNWDNYLSGNRWPTMRESARYQELRARLERLD